jgi:uncharacterized membrane protein YccC
MAALTFRRTAMGAMDAMLFFLFVMQPGVPAIAPTPVFVASALASLGGIAVAIFSFRVLLPVDPARRLSSLLVSIARDLRNMAGAASPAARMRCRGRTQHRVLRMMALAGKAEQDVSAVIEGGLAALALGRSIEALQQEQEGDASPRFVRTEIGRRLGRLAGQRGSTSELLFALKKESELRVANEMR